MERRTEKTKLIERGNQKSYWLAGQAVREKKLGPKSVTQGEKRMERTSHVAKKKKSPRGQPKPVLPPKGKGSSKRREKSFRKGRGSKKQKTNVGVLKRKYGLSTQKQKGRKRPQVQGQAASLAETTWESRI